MTAVEWLVGQLESEKYQKAYGDTYISVDLMAKAKQKEKEQMIDFAKQWQERQNDSNLDTIEMLYNEHYNK